MSESLKGEGKQRTQVRVHRECDHCSEPATHRHTYLLEGTRSNPASKAYGRDDCSRCVDADAFFCSEHENVGGIPNGYVTCAWIEVGGRYDQMFLTWETVETAGVTL